MVWLCSYGIICFIKSAIPIIVIFLFLVFLFGGGFLAVYLSAQSEPTKTLDLPAKLSSEKLMAIANAWRHSQGFQSYTNLQRVCDIASTRLKEIKIDFSHTGFSSKRFCAENEYCFLGENLSHNYSSEQETFNAWLISPEHKENLLANFHFSCIKCEKTYCVQEFANF